MKTVNTQEQSAAFAQAAQACCGAVYRVALGMLRSPADAEDAVSAVTVVTYTGNWNLAYVLGEYIVTLNGKQVTAVWSLDGADPNVFPDYAEMGGEYGVVLSTETGVIEDIWYDAALDGNS